MRKESLSSRTKDFLGLVIPTLLEGNRIVDCLETYENKIIQGKLFSKGYIKGVPVVLVICGIGKANAAHAAGLLIDRYSPSIIINIGVAGAYPSSGLKIGDIVIADKEIYADEGLLAATGDFISIKSLNLPLSNFEDRIYFDLYETFIPSFLKGKLRQGAFLTLSTCTGSMNKAIYLAEQYNGLCENMEGAAIAQVASYCKLPFFELRAMSNLIKDRDKEGIEKKDLIRASEAVQSYMLDMIEGSWLE